MKLAATALIAVTLALPAAAALAGDEQTAARVRADYEKYGKLIKLTGTKVN